MSRNRREGYYIGKVEGIHFRSRVKYSPRKPNCWRAFFLWFEKNDKGD